MESKLKNLEYTLECHNMAVLNELRDDELRLLVLAETFEFDLVVNYSLIDRLPHVIRYLLRDKVPFWWCSVLRHENKILEDIKDLKKKFHSGKSYRITMEVAYLPVSFTPQSGRSRKSAKSAKFAKSGQSSDHKNEKKVAESNDNLPLIMGTIPLHVVFECLYEGWYAHEPLHKKIMGRVQKLIDANNELDIYASFREKVEDKGKGKKNKKAGERAPNMDWVVKGQAPIQPPPPPLTHTHGVRSCYGNDIKAQNFGQLFGKFYKNVISTSRCCILTGETPTQVVKIKGGHIVSGSAISNAAVLWALYDMIWKEMSVEYAFISVNDTRNIIPLEDELEREYDSLYWSFYPEFIDSNLESADKENEDNKENKENEVNMTENDYLWNIEIFTKKKNLKIVDFIEKNKDEIEWRLRVSKYFNDAKVFRRALGMHCFAALKANSHSLISHHIAKAWMNYFNDNKEITSDKKSDTKKDTSPSFPINHEISSLKNVKDVLVARK